VTNGIPLILKPLITLQTFVQRVCLLVLKEEVRLEQYYMIYILMMIRIDLFELDLQMMYYNLLDDLEL